MITKLKECDKDGDKDGDEQKRSFAPVHLHLFLLLGKLQHCSNDLRNSIMAPSLSMSLSVNLPILQFCNYIIQLTDEVSVASPDADKALRPVTRGKAHQGLDFLTREMSSCKREVSDGDDNGLLPISDGE